MPRAPAGGSDDTRSELIVDLEALLANPPALHLDDQGRPAAFAIAEDIMRVIDASVDGGSHTLETGAGLSTALFAAKGCSHTCVVPFATEIERISAWCEEAGVPTAAIDFRQGRSEDILPQLDPSPLDLVLIDGGHGFPSPFIDWYYAGRRLREGGTLVIDDTQIWTGKVLKDFLGEQPGWELVRSLPMRAAVFARTGDAGELDEWVQQPYVVRRSYSRGVRGLVRKAVKAGALVRGREVRGAGRAQRDG